MWASFRKSTKKEDNMQQPCCPSHEGTTVNDEYLSAIRTKSFADFFFKVQVMVKNPPSSSSSKTKHSRKVSAENLLLNPAQETVASLLESSPVFNRKYSDNIDLKSLLANYFDISAQASNFCSRLLNTLTGIQSDYTLIHQLIAAADQRGGALAEIQSRVILNNPSFSNQEFNRIRENHSSILQNLRWKRKRIGRKIKLIKFFKKASGVCIAAACGVLAAAAVFLAIHTLTALVVGPALLVIPIAPLKRKVSKRLRISSKYGFLRKVVKQLDVAAKGAYILNRDFDMMGRLVSRLQDEVEHNKALIRFCLSRSRSRSSSMVLHDQEENSRVCCTQQMLKEMNKCELGLRKQVEELEEHVYLCLVTINRARALVVQEICKDDDDDDHGRSFPCPSQN
ncbi:UPF0496 protein At1g20180-like [Andrographis paniculata]|uniref:UPF0496 protein At1g20180-like n=1 Tax=Andrographis paniculata TaxID=175694 RepID=UPI0021E74B2C|nr:UPF0496 protein At1g20180-like [Andrographis paniculata]